jgi:hypothetical protein
VARERVSLVSNVIIAYELLDINIFTSVNLLPNIQCTQGLRQWAADFMPLVDRFYPH